MGYQPWVFLLLCFQRGRGGPHPHEVLQVYKLLASITILFMHKWKALQILRNSCLHKSKSSKIIIVSILPAWNNGSYWPKTKNENHNLDKKIREIFVYLSLVVSVPQSWQIHLSLVLPSPCSTARWRPSLPFVLDLNNTDRVYTHTLKPYNMYVNKII